MKLQIGLVTHSLVWEQVFRQEGVPFGIVDLSAKDVQEECSLLVVNRTLTGLERENVENYLRNGGAVLGYALHFFQVAGTNSLRERLDYIVSDHDEVFSDIHLIDLGIYGSVPREANWLRTQANTFAVFAGPLGGGFAVILPFDVTDVLNDCRAASKNFYFTRERLPSERVSLVSKGEVRHLLHRSFEYLHHVRALPYAHLWYFPNGGSNIFAFRIDTDGAPRSDVDELYSVARDNQVAMSWYLDVKSHENWLNHFCYMVNQEFGVHCYDHQTFPVYEANLKNIEKAMHAMQMAGLQPAGFTAPFGRWNPELAKALDELSIEYSSEFSYAYDTLPLYPEVDGKRWNTLQVPVHPICIGSMKQIGYSDENMIEYYRRVLDLKISRDEPLFFYHHPTHKSWDVVRFLFNFVKEKNIENVTFGDYAHWWGSRFKCKISLDVNGSVIFAKTENPAHGSAKEAMWLRLSRPSGDSTILPFGEKIDILGATAWKAPKRISPPENIRRIREFDPRATLGRFYDAFKRKFE